MVEIIEVSDRKGLKKFIDMQWDIYKGDKNWVPPLKGALLKTLTGHANPLFLNGPHTFFLAMENGRAVGRIMAGINNRLNDKKSKNEGYISLFESINSFDAAKALFDKALGWLGQQGVDSVVGPVSPTNGDYSRGILIEGFDGPPVLMNSYNPPYYRELFEKYGFSKNMDLYAYYLDGRELAYEKYERVVEYAIKRYGFRIDRFDRKNIDREARDIKKILDLAMPDSWEHLTPPSLEEIRAEMNALIRYMDPDLVYIARKDEEPIGFVVALPDYNQVLKRLNGRLFPFGFAKYLWYKRRIDGMRIFMQFVVPKFRNKAVNSAIYLKLMQEGRKKGYTWGEGSTIAEMNIQSMRNVEGVGGKLYRTYRIYKINV